MRKWMLLMAMTTTLATGACDADTTGPAEGSVEVTTLTSGALVDGDGYTLTVDGIEVASIGVSDTETVTMEAGERQVGLTDLQPPCSVDGDNPVAIDLPAVTTLTVGFLVVC